MTNVLWHIVISHYSEKARWALDFKRIDHVRRRPAPGSHIPIALWVTRGRGFTFPVLQLEGRVYRDSTDILAAVEVHRPDPPLYPGDPAERARALELEDFFDEQLGPYVRRYAFYEMRRAPESFDEVGAQAAPELFAQFGGLAGRFGRALTGARYGASRPDGASAARGKTLAALDRLEAELDGREYLVGNRFTVADLTAAALFYPLVLPPAGPIEISRLPEPLARVRESLADRPGYRWVEEMYRRHR